MKTNVRILFSLLLLFSFILVQTVSAKSSGRAETIIEFSLENPQPKEKEKKNPNLPKADLKMMPESLSVPTPSTSLVWVTYSTLQGASLSLPIEYQPSPIGLSSNICEVQSFSVTNDSAPQFPYFVLDRYFPTEEMSTENSPAYFSDSEKATKYYHYFINQFESRVFYPKSSWEPSEVQKINTEDVLIIRSRYIGQDRHDHYIWAHSHGFFVLTVYYSDNNSVPDTKKIIQKAVETFRLPQ